MKYQFHIQPRDVLFLRDAKPMEASDAGMGANWPRPDQLWSAFINAFHQRWPQIQPWEHAHRKRDGENPESSDRFGALKSVGPFPVDTSSGKIYYPCPLDVLANENEHSSQMSLSLCGSGSNLPAGLKYAFSSTVLGKQEMPQWIDQESYASYLKGESFKIKHETLFEPERNIGVAINPGTGTAIDKKLYQAEYLRFRPETRMAVGLSCDLVGHNRTPVDVFEQIADEEDISLLLGGQQGVVLLHKLLHEHRFGLPQNHVPDHGNYLLRWTLLSPAVFPAIQEDKDKGIMAHPGGWLPNWINPKTMKVMLPKSKSNVKREAGETREAWRKRKASGTFDAELVAARIDKPICFSGWDLRSGPKNTRFAVAPGSVYVFECKSHDELLALVAALAWNGGSGNDVINRRSSVFGEKGFGLGVCSTWKSNEIKDCNQTVN